jgi:hypothetical protein
MVPKRTIVNYSNKEPDRNAVMEAGTDSLYFWRVSTKLSRLFISRSHSFIHSAQVLLLIFF